MDPCLFDVLHHAADDGRARGVGHHVYVDLDGVGQELIYEDRRVLFTGPR